MYDTADVSCYRLLLGLPGAGACFIRGQRTPLGDRDSQNPFGEGIFSENPLSPKGLVSASLQGSGILKNLWGKEYHAVP